MRLIRSSACIDDYQQSSGPMITSLGGINDYQQTSWAMIRSSVGILSSSEDPGRGCLRNDVPKVPLAVVATNGAVRITQSEFPYKQRCSLVLTRLRCLESPQGGSGTPSLDNTPIRLTGLPFNRIRLNELSFTMILIGPVDVNNVGSLSTHGEVMVHSWTRKETEFALRKCYGDLRDCHRGQQPWGRRKSSLKG